MAREFGSRARWAGVFWFLSPVTLWVAAGQPQIEPMSALCLLLAIRAWQRNHAWLAGLVAAVGVNFEFYPAVFLVMPVLDLVATPGRRSWLRTGWVGLGFVCGLTVAFAQDLFSRADRTALLGGLVATQTASPQFPIKARSVWFVWSALHLVPWAPEHWYVIFALASVAILVAAAVGHRRTPISRSLACMGAILVMAGVLDPASLPQFALIEELGLLFIYISRAGPAFAAVLLPVLDLFSWFFHHSWYQFLSDVDPRLGTQGSHLWPTYPVSTDLYVFTAVVAAMGMLAVAGSAAVLNLRAVPGLVPVTHEHPRLPLAIGMVMVSLTLVVQGLQPAALEGLVGTAPRQLFDIPYLVQNQLEPLQVYSASRARGVEVRLATQTRAEVAGTHGVARVALAAPAAALVNQTLVGGSTRTVRLPGWPGMLGPEAVGSVEVKAVSVQLLMHAIGGFRRLDLTVATDRRSYFRPVSVVSVLRNWAFVTYVLPTSALGRGGTTLHFHPVRPGASTFDNASSTGTAFLIVRAVDGEVLYAVPTRREAVPFTSWAGGLRIAAWKGRTTAAAVRLAPGLCSVVICSQLQADVVWPAGSVFGGPPALTVPLGGLALAETLAGLAWCWTRTRGRSARREA